MERRTGDMAIKYSEVISKNTGKTYYVVKSMRGRYFDLVPKSNPAQHPIRCDRRDFTNAVSREVA